METIKLEDFSNHWKESLLGESFWREQERLNRPHEERIEATRGLTLHEQFPFSLSEEQCRRNRHIQRKRQSQQPLSPKKQKRNSRRFSTSDALNLNTLSFNPAVNLLREFNRHSNSHPQYHSQSHSSHRSPAKLVRRAGSLLRASFRLSTMDERSTPPVQDTPVRKSLSSLGNTIQSFHGGEAWDSVSRETDTLCFDVFFPVKPLESPSESTPKTSEKEQGILEIEQLYPLCEFRNLRVLKITGMMQSYQKYIWRAAWMNLSLEELELGMALAPRIKQKYTKSGSGWHPISSEWTFEVPQYCDPVYYGELGDGNLHSQLGTGEYLDKHAIEKARVLAGVTMRTLNRLPIKKLTLSGFVVDADPFIQWFDPRRLRTIHFKENCVDAGFYLTKSMKKVSVLFPRDEDKPVPVRSVSLLKDLKLIELKGGRKVGEAAKTFCWDC